MAFLRSLWLFSSVCLLVPACGGTQPPAAEPSAAPSASVAPKPEPKAEPEEKKPEEAKKPEEPKEQPPTPPPAPEKPKSKTLVGGVSLSDIDEKALVAAAQKIGWAPETVGTSSGTVGKYENIRFTVQNNALEGHIELIRPAHQPMATSASMMPPKDQKEMAESTSAVLFDAEADLVLIVRIDGRIPDAKKLLDRLIKGK